MPKAGEIRYCPELGGKATNAAFVWIPSGSFWMGLSVSNDLLGEYPAYFVAISKGFWLQRNPLTYSQYCKGKTDATVSDISWNDVSNFCKANPLRMPTEAEWEYAAIANTAFKYDFLGTNNLGTNENNRLPNQFNLRGMYPFSDINGEWCQDASEQYFIPSTAPRIDPAGDPDADFRVLRAVSDTIKQNNLRRPHARDSLGVRLIWEPQHA